MGSVSLIRTAANDPQYAARVILADQNQDGEINVADVLLLQRRLLSGERYPPQAALEPVAPGTAGGMERQTSFAALIDYLIHPAHAVPGDPGQLLYVHVDHLGTPVAMTDEQGVKVWSAVYDPFGKATPNEDPDGNGQAVTLNVRFPGQYYDQETGLHYNYFRYHDPGTGRYITSDPIGLRGGLNTYGYVGANPVAWYDLFGLDKLTINSNVGPEAGFTDGHAWLTYTDGDGKSTNYGLWPDTHPLAPDNGPESDVRQGLEGGDSPSYSYSYDLSPDQIRRWVEFLNRHAEWKYTNTCASWASDGVRHTTGDDIDADDWLGFETPREISRSIWRRQ